ncbi:MAG: AraC family transcriptional regulator [Bacteroidota bacterium]
MRQKIGQIKQLTKGENYQVYVYTDIHLDYPMHYHAREYELCLHYGCQGTRFVGDHIDNFGIEDLAFLAPGVPHCWFGHHDSGEYRNANAKVVVIQFNRDFIGEHLLDTPSFQSISNLMHNSQRGMLFYHDTKTDIARRMLKMKEVNNMDQYIEILALLNQLSKSSDWEYLCSPAYSFKAEAGESEKFKIVHSFIMANYTRKLKLAEVAALINLSPSAFSHYFKKQTYRSFSSYVNELRIGYATRLLIETDHTISEAAYASGFNNLSNFNRIFKKLKKISPSDLRRQVAGTTLNYPILSWSDSGFI